MPHPLHRRLNALERSGFAVTSIVDGRGAEAFAAFIAETFGHIYGSHADAAARLYGLPASRHFVELCRARFDGEAHAQIARAAYGDGWKQHTVEVSEEAEDHCRQIHGDDWSGILADRIANAKRVSRYPSMASGEGKA